MINVDLVCEILNNSFITSLEVSWFKSLNVKIMFVEHICLMCIRVNSDQYNSILKREVDNVFWKDALKALSLFYTSAPINTVSQFKSQSFIFNKKIRIVGK